MGAMRTDPAPLRGPSSAEPLREYLLVLRRRKWSILALTALTVVSALVFSFRQTPMYESTVRVQLKPQTASQYLQGVPVTSLISMDTERELAQSVAVSSIVGNRLGRDPVALLKRLSVTIPTNTAILELVFQDPSPQVAAAGADAFANAYLLFKTEQAENAIKERRTQLQDRIDGLGKDLADARATLETAEPGSTEYTAAKDEIERINSDLVFYRGQLGSLNVGEIDPGDVIDPAEVPLEPASPNHVRNGALALAVGLALGVGIAFLRERLDDRIGSREELEEAVGAPVLAIVPRVAGWKKRAQTELVTISHPKGAPAEAYRTIRTNIQFIAREDNFKILTVTSASDGEGKTTTVANLAVTLAQTGKRVLAVSCDLRKPRLHRFFKVENKVGVTNILAGETTLVGAAQRVGIDTLRVIASGPVPATPTELLGSEEMDELLRQFRRAADYVLVDTAPILAVADTLVLAPKSDGVIVVVDSTSTSRAAVEHSREQLEQIGGNVIGGIFNNFDPARARYYSSYYRYYYTYRYRQEPEVERPSPAARVRVPDPEEMWH